MKSGQAAAALVWVKILGPIRVMESEMDGYLTSQSAWGVVTYYSSGARGTLRPSLLQPTCSPPAVETKRARPTIPDKGYNASDIPDSNVSSSPSCVCIRL